jgi:2-haloacid dehalogenase
MLEAVVRSNVLTGYFSHLLSVDAVKSYKPSPAVYELGPSALGLPAREICFVSANPWDAAGAKASGYTVAWCNRAGAAMDELGFTPDVEIRSLDQLPPALGI